MKNYHNQFIKVFVLGCLISLIGIAFCSYYLSDERDFAISAIISVLFGNTISNLAINNCNINGKEAAIDIIATLAAAITCFLFVNWIR